MDYIFQLFKLILILFAFIAITYYVLKNVKNKRINKVSPNRMLQVIDGVSIGMKEEVVLMKVGKEYILLSMNSGNMIALNQEEIVVSEESFDDLMESKNPSFALKDIKESLRVRMTKK